MGHHISAILLQGSFDKKIAQVFELKPISLPQGITLFPLNADYCDRWGEKLDIGYDATDRPLLDCRVVHHIMRQITLEPLFAVIETDYFGGQGDQAAVVYRGEREIMAPANARFGPINEALRHLGVRASSGLDEFDTVGLGGFRDFDDFFDAGTG
jgi:hypothetical protein